MHHPKEMYCPKCGHWIDELTLSRYLDMGPSFRCPNCNSIIEMEAEA